MKRVEEIFRFTLINKYNILLRGDFPTQIINNLVNESGLAGIEILDKTRIL